ncbi:MAG: TIGR03986 family type III CRISPR-associated RAMP protein [Candidatus Cryosericum sp.]
MSDPVKGIVTYRKDKGGLYISWTSKKGTLGSPNALEAKVTRSKQVAAFVQSGNLDVLVELDGGRPICVWCPGEEKPATQAPLAAAGTGSASRGAREARYHNPYNFIPAMPRQALPEQSDLADHPYTRHDKLDTEKWTGRLHVRMTTETPLLIPDLPDDPDVDHKEYPMRVDAAGRPIVAPTSLKGMLRSAYEAVTNSRMGVFSDHGVPLGMRQEARQGLAMVPARMVARPDGRLEAELYTGTTQVDPTGRGEPKGSFMYAAWLPMYHEHDDVTNITRWKHGDHVESFLAVSTPHDKGAPFDYWRVVPSDYKAKDNKEVVKQFKGGWVCISGKNMPPGKKKHDERIFFNANGGAPMRLLVPEEQEKRWENLIDNYYQANERDIRTGAVCPPALGNGCEYSRHIREWKEERTLKEGALCYAAVEWSGQTLKLTGLFPVMISRDLQDASPDQLLDASLKPASDIKHLSPADRVFGWVKDGVSGSKEQSAYRGNLRIGAVQCETGDAIMKLAKGKLTGLPLAIMGQPKSEQGRFYVAANQQGIAQSNGIKKQDAGYSLGKGLRGRKVFPHQNLPQGYWDNPTEDRTQTEITGAPGWYQEYRRPRLNGEEQLDTQNRTVESWVKPGTAFNFDIDVTNLSSVELGALVWILSLGPNRYLKLGSGKAYGFGSVALAIDWDGSQLGKGSDWAAYYRSLTSVEPVVVQDKGAELVRQYQQAVSAAGGVAFEQVPYIKAFVVAAQGYKDSLPTHYPRSRRMDDPSSVPPKPAGEGFKWFSENERSAKGCLPKGLALPDLAVDQGLPYLEEFDRNHRHGR